MGGENHDNNMFHCLYHNSKWCLEDMDIAASKTSYRAHHHKLKVMAQKMEHYHLQRWLIPLNYLDFVQISVPSENFVENSQMKIVIKEQSTKSFNFVISICSSLLSCYHNYWILQIETFPFVTAYIYSNFQGIKNCWPHASFGIKNIFFKK